ncbi:MAG: hypothetical protein WB987_07750 [Candidatus Acidiferrales bacterium]
MNAMADFRSRNALEQYLQDLICGVTSPEEVGVLVETLMTLQLRNTVHESASATAAGA